MFEKICGLLAEKFDADASQMTMDTSIKDDLILLHILKSR